MPPKVPHPASEKAKAIIARDVFISVSPSWLTFANPYTRLPLWRIDPTIAFMAIDSHACNPANDQRGAAY